MNKKEDPQLEALLKFEDIYNPMKPYALMRRMRIPREDAEKLCSWYEDVFYEQALKLYSLERIKK